MNCSVKISLMRVSMDGTRGNSVFKSPGINESMDLMSLMNSVVNISLIRSSIGSNSGTMALMMGGNALIRDPISLMNDGVKTLFNIKYEWGRMSTVQWVYLCRRGVQRFFSAEVRVYSGLFFQKKGIMGRQKQCML